jgi:hypothetical protein
MLLPGVTICFSQVALVTVSQAVILFSNPPNAYQNCRKLAMPHSSSSSCETLSSAFLVVPAFEMELWWV